MQSIEPKTLIAQRNAFTNIIDVREPDEFAAGHVDKSVNVPLSQLTKREGEVPAGAFIICRTGSRSVLATEFLNSIGRNVTNVLGGVTSWPEDLVR